MFGDNTEEEPEEPLSVVQGRMVDRFLQWGSGSVPPCVLMICVRTVRANSNSICVGLRESGRGGRCLGGVDAGRPFGKVKQRRFELPPEGRCSPIADFFQSDFTVPTIGFRLDGVGSKKPVPP